MSIDDRMRRVEVKIRITEDLHRRLIEECGYCGCSITGIATLGIARELGVRKAWRQQEAQDAILYGQRHIEGNINA